MWLSCPTGHDTLVVAQYLVTGFLVARRALMVNRYLLPDQAQSTSVLADRMFYFTELTLARYAPHPFGRRAGPFTESSVTKLS